MAEILSAKVYEEYNNVFIEVCYEKDEKRYLKTFIGMDSVPKTVQSFMSKAGKTYQFDGSAMGYDYKTFEIDEKTYNQTIYKN